jgi:hypothetical protein
MLKEICQWIEANSTFVLGTTLQCGHRTPSAPDRCVVVQETGGGDTNFDQPDMEWIQVQVVTRGETYFNARDDARTIHALLHGAAGITIGTAPATQYIIGAITAVNPPQYIGQDDTRRFEFSTNYRVALYNKSGH